MAKSPHLSLLKEYIHKAHYKFNLFLAQKAIQLTQIDLFGKVKLNNSNLLNFSSISNSLHLILKLIEENIGGMKSASG